MAVPARGTLPGPWPVKTNQPAPAESLEAYYGLREKPFSLLPDPRFQYRSPAFARVFDELSAGILRRENLSVLTGDIGTGKTTLCRSVLSELNQKMFSAFVPDPFATREDFLKMILIDFGVVTVEDLLKGRLKNASSVDLTYLLYEFLGTLAPLDAFAVVVIDEAQHLSASLLEEIRILTDASGQERQLQVILIGQPELTRNLKTPEMEQVDRRVSIRCELEALNAAEVAAYVTYRLQVAGGSPERVWFSSDAIALVHRMSGGVPRLINRICDRALSEGHLKQVAEIDGATVTTGNHVVLPAATPVVTPEVGVEPDARPAPAKEFTTQIDTWLTTVDASAKVETHEHGAPPVPGFLRDPEEDISAAVEAVKFVNPGMSRTAPVRFVERVVRMIGRIALWLIVLAAVAAGVSYMVSLTTGTAVLPDLPARPVVVVAPMPEPSPPPEQRAQLPR